MQSLKNRGTEEYWAYGVYTPGGVQMYGHTNVQEAYKCGDIQTAPQYKTCLPLKLEKKPI